MPGKAVSVKRRAPRRARWPPRPAGVASHAGTLYAAEINARRAFARWLAAHQQALGDIIEHGTWLDRTDVDALLGLSIPGVDELVGLSEVIRLARTPEYDEVVVD